MNHAFRHARPFIKGPGTGPVFPNKLVISASEEERSLHCSVTVEPVSAALLSQRCGMLPLRGPVCSFLMKEIQANYKVLGLTGPAWVLCKSPTLQLWGGSPSLKAQSDSEKTEQLRLTWRLKSLLPVDHLLCTKAKNSMYQGEASRQTGEAQRTTKQTSLACQDHQ